MGLDNSLIIREFLSFGENDFYFVQLIKRRKDNPDMTKDVKIIKSYYINSFDDYNNLIPKIIETCDRENCFLTEKACKEHIESNHYHYTDPKDYLNHAWRNPEMELISKFLCGLVGKEIYT